MTVRVKEDACICCGACVIHCPFRAIYLHGGAAHVDPAKCRRCLKCVPRCYMRAIIAAPSQEEAPRQPLSEG